TEAGDGEEGRIKSAVGIGALLEDGIGDTIRVSLTEDPVAEVPVAFQIVKKYNKRSKTIHQILNFLENEQNGAAVNPPNPFAYDRRETLTCDLVYHQLGSQHLPRVEMTLFEPLSTLNKAVQTVAAMLSQNVNRKLVLSGQQNIESEFKCETIHIQLHNVAELMQLSEFKQILMNQDYYTPLAVDFTNRLDSVMEVSKLADRLVYSPNSSTGSFELQKIVRSAQFFGRPIEWKLSLTKDADRTDQLDLRAIGQTVEKVLNVCQERDDWNILFSLSNVSNNSSIVAPYRYLAGRLDALGANIPLLLRYRSEDSFKATLLEASTQLGTLLCDGIGDAIHIEANLPVKDLLRLSYNILQATRLRISKTEFISCPSCGRTLFDLQTTTERIKSKTAHLKGVKIAIMGCIVNGPGEMADADFGYVGAGPKKVNLFVGKECVKRNIPEEIADAQLIELIKSHGKWMEP
ncbi:MAG: flavodoxin-dependent (E)-4-hydroxy-3-methylbut-2-enyl-diphosphate synthase, partial [bacterium]